MNLNFKNLMSDATRLTRAGDLGAATAAIQAALAGRESTAGEAVDDAPPAAARWPAIDVDARELPQAPVPETPDPVRPDSTGGQFIAGRYTTAMGGREYKLYIPPGAGPTPLPLVVMLHGCTQDPDDFAAGTAMN